MPVFADNADHLINVITQFLISNNTIQCLLTKFYIRKVINPVSSTVLIMFECCYLINYLI
jgi:hypothetical protein